MARQIEIGGRIDRYFKAVAKRKAAEQKIKALKADEATLEREIRDRLRNEKLEGARGKLGSCAVGEKILPTVEDWSELYAHIKKTGEFELLQKRIGQGACIERWDAGASVPGVKREREVVIRFTPNRAKVGR